MRVLLDLQALQTQGAAERGVGTYTRGLLKALAARHEVIGLRRAGPFLAPAGVEVPMLEAGEAAQAPIDAVIHCSGPFWEENTPVPRGTRLERALFASIFYDAIPWVYPERYLPHGDARLGYHNRCVELYARADLVCAISGSAAADALRLGYANPGSIATIGAAAEPLECSPRPAREAWSIPRPYLLTVSGDDYRKNPHVLVEGYLASRLRETHDLVLVISNDAETGFSRRLARAHPDAARRGVRVLPQVGEAALGALYRDCAAFVYASLYEGFGIPLVEAMQAGKWIIASTASSIGEVAGSALLEPIADPRDAASIAAALDRAQARLAPAASETAAPRARAAQFTWSRVVERLEEALHRRREAGLERPGQKRKLYWASPFPADISGIAFYSSDLAPLVARKFDLVLVPNDPASFVPSAATGRFRAIAPEVGALAAGGTGELPLVLYQIGNSPFHLDLVALLDKVPGVVLLHDAVLGGLADFWNEREVERALRARRHSALPQRLRAWCARLGKLDRLLEPSQPTRLRRSAGRLARLPGLRAAVVMTAARFRALAWGEAGALPAPLRAAARLDRLLEPAQGGWARRLAARLVERRAVAAAVSLLARGTRALTLQTSHLPPASAPQILRAQEMAARIIEASRALVLLCEHAKAFLPSEVLRTRPQHLVPLYARARGGVSDAERAALRRKYGIPPDAFVVTTTGFQAPIKLTHQLVNACLALRRLEGAPVFLQVLGRLEPAAYRAQVHAALEGSALGRFISEHFLDEAQLVERTALSDLAVFLRAQSNGGPSAGLNDALGLGIACLVTDDFAFREYPPGAFRPIANEALVEELRALYRDPAARIALGAAGLRFAQEHAPAHIAGRLCEVLEHYAAAAA
jgi:glycosyltransferase involved in cell wall biosynthesis